jgi:hypothetical protein
MHTLVAILIVVVSASTAAQAQKDGGSLPKCSDYCTNLGSAQRGMLGPCMKNNAAAGRCQLKGPVKDNRPGGKG